MGETPAKRLPSQDYRTIRTPILSLDIKLLSKPAMTNVNPSDLVP
jgi:hypothetical protein